jgi:hypothetical protein
LSIARFQFSKGRIGGERLTPHEWRNAASAAAIFERGDNFGRQQLFGDVDRGLSQP